MKLILPILLFACLCMGGCSQADVDRAKAANDAAIASLNKVESARAEIVKALDEARALASSVGGSRADALIAKVESKLEVADDGVKIARAVADATGKGLEDAKKSLETGGTALDVAIGVLQSILMYSTPVLAVAVPIISKYRKALTLTAAHGDRMEVAQTPDEIKAAKDISIAEQVAGGVKSIIERART